MGVDWNRELVWRMGDHHRNGSMNTGTKFDEDKLRFDLIPPEVEEALATILTYGAAKYNDRNWELGMNWGRLYGALRRHLHAWKKGEKLDEESKLPHLWHALTCLTFLVTYEMRGSGKDDITGIGDTFE